MRNARMVTLLVVVAHWIIAIGHLFLAAKALPGPKLSNRPAGAVLSIFFLAALSADLYEHFAHSSWLQQLATGAQTKCGRAALESLPERPEEQGGIEGLRKALPYGSSKSRA